MKVKLLTALRILLVLLIGAVLFWDPIIDALPIDQSGWRTDASGTYYLNEDGDPITGWQEIEGFRYCFDVETGAMRMGWVEEDGKLYHLDAEGRMQTNCWITDSQGSRYLLSDGSMATGWLDVGQVRYYLDEQGYPVTGWQTFANTRFHFGSDGAMTLGWLEEDGCRYYLNEDGSLATGWLETEEGSFYLDESGVMQTGWVHTVEGSFCLGEDGKPLRGWQEMDGVRYYLNEDGSPYFGWLKEGEVTFYLTENGTPHTGWLETDGKTYYFHEDGTMAKGRVTLKEKNYYFTSTGAQILLVNRWNPLPDDYAPEEVVDIVNGAEATPACAAALEKLLDACKEAGYTPFVRTAYRNQSFQRSIFQNKVAQVGYDKAIQIVAIPGTSEHHTGDAVDIVDATYKNMNYNQADRPTQQWLMEHCWEYGFILRYPDGTSNITGIIYEPWHYRYVGVELAMELKELGLCLEEYLDMLTGDGSTCGGGGEMTE